MVGRSVLDWDLEIYFPQPRTNDDLAVGMALNDTRYVASATQMYDTTSERRMLGSNIVVGTGAGLYVGGVGGAAGGVPQYRFQAGAPGDLCGFGFQGIRAIVPTVPGVVPLPAGASWPSINRVWWLRLLVSYDDLGGGNAGDGTGVLVMPEDLAQVGWTTELVGAQNRGGFGLTGDGAGQWRYASYDRTGVGLLRENVALPVHTMLDYNLAEWVIVGARPGFNSYVEFWFNNTLILTRNWLGALLEPIGGVGAANPNEWCWVPHARILNQAALFIAAGVMRTGRFLRDGTEIQG